MDEAIDGGVVIAKHTGSRWRGCDSLVIAERADSTQYSLTSSVFRLHRLSTSRVSLAETSVAGTPAAQSPVVDGARRDARPTAIPAGMAFSPGPRTLGRDVYSLCCARAWERSW